MKFVVIDVETTGRKAKLHRIIEIAYQTIEITPKEVITTSPILTARFRPSRAVAYEPEAYAINGYSEDNPDWLGAPEIDSAEAKQALEYLSQNLKDNYVAGHNVGFDTAFLHEEFRRYGLIYPWHYRTLDTSSFASMVAVFKGLPKVSLQEAYEATGGRMDGITPHRGASDVAMTLHLIKCGHRAWDLFDASSDRNF